MTKPLAVYTDTDDLHPDPGIALLEAEGFEIRRLDTVDKDRIIAESQDAKALLVGFAEIDADVIDALPNVEIYSLLSMGFNNIDVDHATSRGKWVTNVQGAASNEVANHALALSLAVTRGIRPFSSLAESGRWGISGATAPKDVGAMTVSVLGFGRIGRRFAELAHGVFGNVVVHDPYVKEADKAALAEKLEFVSLDEAISRADLLSLHMPLTAENRGFLYAGRLAAMPANSIVINVSRGELIDEDALVASLDSGHTYGAGLDVLIEEPPVEQHPLLGRADVIVTPHSGFLSERTFIEYPETQANNVIAYFHEGRPLTPVNDLG